MDEIIWVYVGVIAIIIAFATIASFLYNKSVMDNETVIENTVNALSNFCNKVCQMPEHTRQSVEVKFVRDSILYNESQTIFIQTNERRYAVHCDCNIEGVKILNLTDAPFQSLDYDCFFERARDGIKVECKV